LFPHSGRNQPIKPPMISPIMICIVSDGRYQGRRVAKAPRLTVADESSTDLEDCRRLRNQETANLCKPA
jgi:hypothetical protein